LSFVLPSFLSHALYHHALYHQAHFVILMHAKMKSLREEHGRPFRRPGFRVVVLWVSETVSVERQLARGVEAKQENSDRLRKGLPALLDVERQTDYSEQKARSRYKTFHDNYEVITMLQKHFHFSVIDGTPVKSVVAQQLVKEFEYQVRIFLCFILVTHFLVSRRWN
jgi:adenylate kinase